VGAGHKRGSLPDPDVLAREIVDELKAAPTIPRCFDLQILCDNSLRCENYPITREKPCPILPTV